MTFPMRVTRMMVVAALVVPVAPAAWAARGTVYWNNGQRAWIGREGPGVMLGDIDSGRYYNFNRS